MATATLSSKNQIVIPKEIRQALKLKQGVKVYIYTIDNEHASISREPIDHLAELKGLGKEIWKSLGGGEKYIQNERASWGDR